jgi:N-acetylmuramoyl-L-alanine amidase
MEKTKPIPIMGLYRTPANYEHLNYGDRPQEALIDTLVLHYTVLDYTQSFVVLTAERGVSAHYLIREDGHIDDLVPDEKKAWHAGVSNWRGKESVNDFSIGIEIVNPGSGDQDCYPVLGPAPECYKNPFSTVQLEALCTLIDYLKSIHPNIEERNIVGHNDITAYSGRKIDPGAAFDWKYLADNGHGIYPAVVLPPKWLAAGQMLLKFGDEGEDVKGLQHKLNLYGYNITENGLYDQHTANVVRAFNLHFNQNPEFGWGIWDPAADSKLDNLLDQLTISYDEIQYNLRY